MTVREYIIENQDKASYTIKLGRKKYLCNKFDANSFFGNMIIKKVDCKYNNENMPIIFVM